MFHLKFLKLFCLVAAIAVISVAFSPVLGETGIIYSGVASGDATDTSVVLWTRTTNAVTHKGVTSNLTAQISTDPKFGKISYAINGGTNPQRDYTLKVDVQHLQQFFKEVASTRAQSPSLPEYELPKPVLLSQAL